MPTGIELHVHAGVNDGVNASLVTVTWTNDMFFEFRNQLPVMGSSRLRKKRLIPIWVRAVRTKALDQRPEDPLRA